MQTIELAKQLAKALAESTEYQAYKAAQQTLEQHEAAKQMLTDFRTRQFELERKKASGAQLLEPLENEIKKLAEIISLNPFVREYLMAEFQFAQIMMEVQKIIGEAVGLEMPPEQR